MKIYLSTFVIGMWQQWEVYIQSFFSLHLHVVGRMSRNIGFLSAAIQIQNSDVELSLEMQHSGLNNKMTHT